MCTRQPPTRQDSTLTDNGSTVNTGTGTTMNFKLPVQSGGTHTVIFTANDGSNTAADTFTYTVNPVLAPQDPPSGSLDGINYLSNSSVRLQLYAPNKDYVYVVGDFNGWQADTNYFMRKSTDGNTFWLEISGLTPGADYTYQYWVDGEIKVADPYSELVLDPDHDAFVNTFPSLPAYPTGLADGIVTVLQPGKAAYNWQTTNFQRPQKTDLVVYELLIRDFLHAHDYENAFGYLGLLRKSGRECH